MTNLGVFPAVPIENTSLRFTITRLNDEEEIDRMVTTLAGQHHLALKDEFDLRKVQMAFKMKTSTKRTKVEEFIEQFKVEADMDISHVHSIIDLNAVEWNEMHAGEGAYDAKNLSLFEDIFHSGSGLGNHWEWDYITIRDAKGRIILSTFLTTTLYKDDMLASNEVSAHIETIRDEKGQEYMTTRTLSIDCPITAGKHMYIDAAHPLKEKALRAFMDKLQEIQESRAVDNVILRDFVEMDEQIDYLIKENGFLRSAMPSGNELDLDGLSSLEDFIGIQSYKSRRHIRSRILKYADRYTVQILSEVDESRSQDYYKLYKGLKKSKMEINTFDLPVELFRSIGTDAHWDKMEVSEKLSGRLVAVIFNYGSNLVYNLMFIGVEPLFSRTGVYRQALLASIGRALDLGCKKVSMGFSADVEKHNLGCVKVPTHAYLQAKDHFSIEYMENLMQQSKEGIKG